MDIPPQKIEESSLGLEKIALFAVKSIGSVKSNFFRQFHTSSIRRTDDLHPRIETILEITYNPSSLLEEFDQNLKITIK